MSIENSKLMNLEDGKLLYDDLRKRVDLTKRIQNVEIASFTDGASGLPMSVKVSVDAVQDLHGYDYPWPAGGWKNLLDESVIELNAISTEGNKIEIGNDVYRSIWNYPLKAGTYTFSTDVYDCRLIRIMIGTVITTISLKQNTYTFTLTEDTVFSISFRRSDSASITENIHCMIEAGSHATSYAPYANICPITGWDQAKVTGTGKNLYIASDRTENYYIAVDGTITANNGFCYSALIPVTSGESYTAKGIKVDSGGQTKRLHGYDSFGNWVQEIDHIAVTTGANTSYQIVCTIPNGVAFVRFSIAMNDTDVMVCKTADASNYVQGGTTVTIPFTSTNYGGTVTLNKDGSADVVVERGIDDLGNYDYTYDSTYGRFIASTVVSDIYNSGSARSTKCICSMYKCLYNSEPIANVHNGDFYIGTKNIIIHDNSTTDVNVFNAKVTGQKIVYPLATPTTYHIDNVGQLLSLLGENNVWADCGNVLQLDYSADTKSYIDNLFATLTNATGVSF